MITLANVYSAIEETGAGVIVYPDHHYDAATIEMGGFYDIYVNPYNIATMADYQTKLMHEYGHCATGCTHRVYSPYQLVAKNEYKADRCAIERFLPWAEIKKAVSTGLTEYWQLAEYFNVNEEFIRKAVHYYKDVKQLNFEDTI